jgi:BlaI family penicillinase repressor
MTKKPTILGKFELEIMHIIWDRGKATVQEVKDALSQAHPAAYTTFLTMMRRMEKKGILEHEMHEDGKTYVYKPLISREEVSMSMFQDIHDRLFRGSSERLLNVLNALFRKEKITPEEIKRLREIIAEKEEQNERNSKSDQ